MCEVVDGDGKPRQLHPTLGPPDIVQPARGRSHS